MQSIEDVLGSVRPWIEQLSQALQSVEVGWLSIVLVVSLLLAAFSRRIVCFVAACLLCTLALVLLVSPSTATSALAVAAAAGALLVALAGIAAMRRNAAIVRHLAILESRVIHLEAAEERRLVTQLKSPNSLLSPSTPLD